MKPTVKYVKLFEANLYVSIPTYYANDLVWINFTKMYYLRTHVIAENVPDSDYKR